MYDMTDGFICLTIELSLMYAVQSPGFSLFFHFSFFAVSRWRIPWLDSSANIIPAIPGESDDV